MPTIALDFETYYDKHYGIQECGLYGYTRHENFDPYMISVADGSESWAGEPKDFNWDSLEGATLVSHNAAFDRTVYEAMVEKKLAPKINYQDWVCSANLSAYICNRRSLADASKFLLGIDVDKSMRSYMKGKTWADAIKEGQDKKLLEYARLDAVHCYSLWTKFSDRWPARERALSAITIDQGTRGIQLDIPRLNEYISIAQEAILTTEKSIPWMEAGSKPTSTKAIAEQCRKHGIPCPPIKSHEDGEEKFAWWQETFGPKFAWVKAVSDWRVINKLLGTLERMKAWARPDGTMTFSLKFFGAHTGRWSGDSGLNMQNLRKDPVCVGKDGLLTGDAKKASAALDIRSLFIPRPGKRMIISDLSQIEPRVLAWLTGNHGLLEKISGGMSIYEFHARQSLGWAGGDLKASRKAADKLLYKRAKAEVLALGYGCGSEKYVEAAWTLAKYKVAEDAAKQEVDSFRANNPKITALWRHLDTEFRNSMGQDFTIELPSGRTMTYEKVGREVRRFKHRETGKTETKLVYTANVGGIRRQFYGGMLTENITQATARDVFGEHLVQLDKTDGVKVLFNAHDEAVLEVDEGVGVADVSRVMSRCPEWLTGCPVACEAKEVSRYEK